MSDDATPTVEALQNARHTRGVTMEFDSRPSIRADVFVLASWERFGLPCLLTEWTEYFVSGRRTREPEEWEEKRSYFKGYVKCAEVEEPLAGYGGTRFDRTPEGSDWHRWSQGRWRQQMGDPSTERGLRIVRKNTNKLAVCLAKQRDGDLCECGWTSAGSPPRQTTHDEECPAYPRARERREERSEMRGVLL